MVFEGIPWLNSERWRGAHKVTQHPQPQPESTQLPTLQSLQITASSTDQPESWESDLIDFLRVSCTRTENRLEKEKAQKFANWLDVVRHPVDHLNWASDNVPGSCRGRSASKNTKTISKASTKVVWQFRDPSILFLH